jgi:PleD family two-component response regulator
MKTDWVNEINTKSGTLSTLIKSTSNLKEEDKSKLQKAKNLVSLIRSDGSTGVHNYMVLSSLLDKSIKEMKEISKAENN